MHYEYNMKSTLNYFLVIGKYTLYVQIFQNSTDSVSLIGEPYDLVLTIIDNSGFSSNRRDFSPFTKDLRGEEHYNESIDLFFTPLIEGNKVKTNSLIGTYTVFSARLNATVVLLHIK